MFSDWQETVILILWSTTHIHCVMIVGCPVWGIVTWSEGSHNTLYALPAVTSIQNSACVFPPKFTAVHTYQPVWLKVARRIVYVFSFRLPRSTPFLVQLICTGWSPLTMHVKLKVELNATEWFRSSGLRTGEPWKVRENQSHYEPFNLENDRL